MRILPISSVAPGELADFASLTDAALRRRIEPERGLYLAESAKIIARALRAGHRPRAVLLQEKWLPGIASLLEGHPETPVYLGDEAALEAIAGFRMHRGAIASMHRPELPDVVSLLAEAAKLTPGELMGTAEAATRSEYGDTERGRPPCRSRVAVCGNPVSHTYVGCSGTSGAPNFTEPPKKRSRIAILDSLVDHTNVGACFRSAAAMGVDAVLVTPTCADPLYRRSIRVSMGTVFQVPWTRLDPWPDGIDQLKEAGYLVAGMTLGEDSITLDGLVAEAHEKLALVFGSEGHGLAAQTEKALDRRVTIPMMGGVDSLNVAAASAVTFYATR